MPSRTEQLRKLGRCGSRPFDLESRRRTVDSFSSGSSSVSEEGEEGEKIITVVCRGDSVACGSSNPYYRPKTASSEGRSANGREEGADWGDNERLKYEEEALALDGGSGHDSTESRSFALAGSPPQYEGEEPPSPVESLDAYCDRRSEQQENTTESMEMTEREDGEGFSHLGYPPVDSRSVSSASTSSQEATEQQEDATVATEVTEGEEGEWPNNLGHPPVDSRSVSSASASSQETSEVLASLRVNPASGVFSSMVVCVGSNRPCGDQGELSRTKSDGIWRGGAMEAAAAANDDEGHDESHDSGIASSASLASKRLHMGPGRGKQPHARGNAQSDDGESADDGMTGWGGPASPQGKEEQAPFRRSAPPNPFDSLTGILGGRGRSKERRRVTWSQDHTTAYIDELESPCNLRREASLPPLPGDYVRPTLCPKIMSKDIADSMKATGWTGSAPPAVSRTHDMSSKIEGGGIPSTLNSSKSFHSSISCESDEGDEKHNSIESSTRRADWKGPSEGPHLTSRLHHTPRTTVRHEQKHTSARSMRAKAFDLPSSGSEDEDDDKEEDISRFSSHTMPSIVSTTSLLGYKLGCRAKCKSHMIIPSNAQSAIKYAYSLKSLDFAFVRRRFGEWTYAIVADKPFGDDGPRIRFVVDEMGSTKTIRKGQWADGVRLVNNGLAQINYDMGDDDKEWIAPTREVVPARDGGARRAASAPAMPKRGPGTRCRGRERARESLVSIASDMAVIGSFRSCARSAIGEGHKVLGGLPSSPVTRKMRCRPPQNDVSISMVAVAGDFEGGRRPEAPPSGSMGVLKELGEARDARGNDDATQSEPCSRGSLMRGMDPSLFRGDIPKFL